MQQSAVIIEAASRPQYETISALFREYEAGLAFDLCFQHFDQELANLPGEYSRPQGCLLMAEVKGMPGGCVAVRPFSGAVCEMKRLYVRQSYRGLGLGRMLCTRAIGEAKAMGYASMRLDTIKTMIAARTLYASLGFKARPAYRHNPLPEVEYLELDLNGG